MSPLYQKWIERYEPTGIQLEEIGLQDHKLRGKQKISVITPVFDPDRNSLVSAIESVLAQTYEDWELCLADDGSTKPYVADILQDYRRRDKRVKIASMETHKGISDASNLALSMATGNFIALLDHDDELAPFALHEVLKLVNNNRPDIVYSDEDKIDLKGYRYDPFFKPDWSPDLLLSYMYSGHLGIYRRTIVAKLGGFRHAMSGAQDYDLFLRSSELTSKIFHIPKILYHWRAVLGSVAGSLTAKEWALQAGKRALVDTMHRRSIVGKIEDGFFPGHMRFKRDIEGSPTVTVVIATRKPSFCVSSVESLDAAGVQKILITPNINLVPSKILKRPDVRTIKSPDGNLPRMCNAAAELAEGEHLLFLASGVAVQGVDALAAMLEHSQRPEIGAVGGKILRADGTVAHAGFVLGLGGVAGNAFHGYSSHEPGYFTFLNVVRNCTAVSGSCFMVKKSCFMELNGFDTRFDSSFCDLDFCLRLREQNKLQNVYTPYAVSRIKSVEDGSSSELDALKFVEKWHSKLDEGDPYYNVNLSCAVPYEVGYPLFSLERVMDNSAVSALIEDYMRQHELQAFFPPAQAQSFKKLLDWESVHLPDKAGGVTKQSIDDLQSKIALSKPWFA
jgi:glycosyltransferase involved in cell wall biosynthesis